MAKTQEQFPDFDKLGEDEPKKGKKGGKKKKGGAVQVSEPKQEVEEDDGTAWKGKPSTFFELKQGEGPGNDPANPNNLELNQEQWSFMY